MALTATAHNLIAQHFGGKTKGTALDATCGNGHDTEFLAKLGFEKVIGLDIQENAIANTAQRLNTAGLKNLSLHCLPHQNLGNLEIDSLNCVMFNFGYLPNSDKSITTLAESSLAAIKAALQLLIKDGLMTLLCYPGHEQGKVETKAIQNWLDDQHNDWQITEHRAASSKPDAPILYTVQHLNS